MISYNTEYFGNNCYFYLRDRGNKISLYYSVGESLNESKKNDERQDFDKMDSKKLKSFMSKVLKSKKKYSKEQIKKMLNPKKSEELDEFVDDDGTMLSSRIPILRQTDHTDNTMEKIINNTRQSGNPYGGRRYFYGEGTKNREGIVSEIDYSDAFGFEETEYLDYDETVDTLDDMGVENGPERAKVFGKLPKQKVRKDKEGDPVLKQRLVEKGALDEEQKKKMIKMVEDILTKKSKNNSDVVSKENPISKILVKNLNSIKKIADKEGISINQLIKILKTNE
jgi:hypothetical protein